MKPVDCIELVELVTDYLEGAMPDAERERVDEHIAGCDGCTTYLQQFRITIRLTGELTEEQITPEARDVLVGVFRQWRAAR